MNLRTIFISSFLSLSSLGVLAQERINLGINIRSYTK